MFLLETEHTAQYVTSIEKFIEQNRLLINQITQRETTTVKLQVRCTFTPTTIEYFSKAVTPKILIVRYSDVVMLQFPKLSLVSEDSIFSIRDTALRSFLVLPKTVKALLKQP